MFRENILKINNVKIKLDCIDVINSFFIHIFSTYSQFCDSIDINGNIKKIKSAITDVINHSNSKNNFLHRKINISIEKRMEVLIKNKVNKDFAQIISQLYVFKEYINIEKINNNSKKRSNDVSKIYFDVYLDLNLSSIYNKIFSFSNNYWDLTAAKMLISQFSCHLNTIVLKILDRDLSVFDKNKTEYIDYIKCFAAGQISQLY